MKNKIVTRFVLGAMCFMLVGCTKNESANTETSTVAERTEDSLVTDLNDQMANGDCTDTLLEEVVDDKSESEDGLELKEDQEAFETDVESEESNVTEEIPVQEETDKLEPIPELQEPTEPTSTPETAPAPAPQPQTSQGAAAWFTRYEIPRDLGSSTENYVMQTDDEARAWCEIYPNGWLRTEDDMLLFTPAGKPAPVAPPEETVYVSEQFGYKVGDTCTFYYEDGTSKVLTYVGRNSWADETGNTKYTGHERLDGSFGVYWIE